MPNFFFPFCPSIPSGYLKYHHDMPSIIGKNVFLFLTSALYQVMAFIEHPFNFTLDKHLFQDLPILWALFYIK
jgi:hypothetical protein